MEYFVPPVDVIFAPFARYTIFMMINSNVSNILNMEDKSIIGKLASYLGPCYS